MVLKTAGSGRAGLQAPNSKGFLRLVGVCFPARSVPLLRSEV